MCWVWSLPGLIVNKMPDSGNAIIAACKGSSLLESYGHVLDYTDLGEEGYILYGSGTGKDPVILTGNTEISVLYVSVIIFGAAGNQILSSWGYHTGKRIVLLTYGIGR